MSKQKHYPDVDPNPNFPAIEKQVLEFWEKEQVFEKSVENRPAQKGGKNNEFIFYDGPPFANGLPHYGHLLTGFVKDLVARYQTMKGKRVERRFGWDCHGLPAEMGAEKELGISGRAKITEYGIGKFNEFCRTSVMKYTQEWRDYVSRQARWVDFDNDYKTMDKNFMESVLWAFKQLYEKGWVYEAYRVMPYSWAAETPLSNFETKLDNSYRDRTDKSVTVAFELEMPPKGLPEYLASRGHSKVNKYYVLAWTTTPWTLPSNLGLAISKKVEYGCAVKNGDCYILSKSSSANYVKELSSHDDGVSHLYPLDFDLLGLTYKPLFPYFSGHPDSFRILDGSDFIEEGSGTGVVHMAPGFGEDDQKLCERSGIEVVCPVDEKGCYTDELFDLPMSYIARPSEQGELLLETPRLRMRPFRAEEYELYKALQADPKVAATTSDGVLPEEKIRAEFDRFQKDQKEKGFTQWAVFRKADGKFIGRAGVDNRDYDQFNSSGKKDVELRYALLSDFWGQGYATELAIAVLDWTMEHVKPELVIAGCNPTYDPAVKLLSKLGFTSHQHVDFRNQTVWYHTLEPQHWQQHRTALLGPSLSLKGLNVLEDTRKSAEEKYDDKQLAKYGLANLRIVDYLKKQGSLIKQEDYTHSYPHCWRTDKPLIYKALPSWYVKVTAFRDRAVELNKQINWIPDHIRDGQMGHMLATAPDWSISRNRFWGTPIPVWRSKSGKIKVFGSIAELEAASGKKITDLHRPYIDEIVITEGGEEYTRVTDVFDCWFESGSMPFAQVHYPFENKEWFETHFPADFITEYVGQTRGWFNTLIILATALFDKPAFQNCICHGVVLDAETGLKYSKRLKNYKDPMEVIDQFGADALRWLMVASPVMRGQDLMVDPEGKFIRDVVRLHIKPIWNAYNFFTLYANADGVKAELLPDGSSYLMDAYIHAKCARAIMAIENALDAYDTPSACEAVAQFFEVLNNWYIRRSKERFWQEKKDEYKQAAYDTLYTVLCLMCRAASPLLPLTMDEIYRGLTGEGSVHLANFPVVNENPDVAKKFDTIVQQMDRVRDICNAGLAIRSKSNIRVRQPLQSVMIVAKEKIDISELGTIILDELNIKQLSLHPEGLSNFADLKLSLNNSVLGKRLPEKMKQIIPASKQGKWELKDGRVHICDEVLLPEEYTLNLEPKPEYKDRAQALSTNDALVVLDLTITPELEQEGIARDMVRMIQQARKDAGLDVSDRIVLNIDVPEKLFGAVVRFKDYIAEQTLATTLETGKAASAKYSCENTLDGETVKIGISVAA